MSEGAIGWDEPGGAGPGTFGTPQLSDVLAYRKAAIAVVGTYLGADDGFVEAVLADGMDEYLAAQEDAREQMKEVQYDEYLALLGREIQIRYAATAAETLLFASSQAATADVRTMGDGGIMSATDDVNAVVRVHEIFEYLESPAASDEAEAILAHTKRQLCNYYNACAFALVKGQLLAVIIAAAEELYRGKPLTAARTRELIIAAEVAGA